MNNFESYLETRKNIYLLLSFCYYMEVNKKYLNDIKNAAPIFELIKSSSEDGRMVEGCKLLKDFFDKTEIDGKLINNLACEYAKLFLINSKDAGIESITAHESVYLSDSKMMMQNERDEVLRFYCEEGMALVDDIFKEPEDHISAELYFISKMSEECVKAFKDKNTVETKRNLKRQYDFLNEHTIRWIEQLSADIVSATQYDFYKAIALITAGFIRVDYTELGELLNEIESAS